MKTASLHFKINYLAIEQQELINDGNKFLMEIYALVTQSRAPGHAQMEWGDKKYQKVENISLKPLLSPLVVTFWDVSGSWIFGFPGAVGRSQVRSQTILLAEMLPDV